MKSTELDPQYDTFMLTTVFFFRFLCFLLPLFPSLNTSMTNTGRVEIDHQLDTFLYYVDNRVFPSLSKVLSKVSWTRPTALSFPERILIKIRLNKTLSLMRHGDNRIFSHFPPMLPFFLEKIKPPPPPLPLGSIRMFSFLFPFAFLSLVLSYFLYKSCVFIFSVFSSNLELLKS